MDIDRDLEDFPIADILQDVIYYSIELTSD